MFKGKSTCPKCDGELRFLENALAKSRPNRLALSNLEWLLQTAGTERVMVRVPLIPGFNSEADRQRSVEKLQAMGVKQLDLFTYRVKTK